MRAMDGQDVMLCSLEGSVLTMAQNIVAALAETSVKRIIWITGTGIHHEISGVHGMMLSQYAKKTAGLHSGDGHHCGQRCRNDAAALPGHSRW